MTNTNFTPGPWITDGFEIRSEDGLLVANVQCLVARTPWKPNASLIAAAPELLGFVRLFLAVAHSGHIVRNLTVLTDEANAVITKAKGE